MMKYVFVTGGVVSSLGKGTTAASLGRLLKARGYKVAMQKCDTYYNFNPALLSPLQHGENFITEDGVAADLDLGHYERFIDESLKGEASITTGKIHTALVERELRGEYHGATITVVPHVTNEIKHRIITAAENSGADIAIIEIGGVAGDIEASPYLEAIRQLKWELGAGNTCFIHVALMPYLSVAGEMKTKPTQHSVKALRAIGIQPDVIVCRTEVNISQSAKDKIALFCNVPVGNVVQNRDASTLFEVPLNLEKEGLAGMVLKTLKLDNPPADLTEWTNMVARYDAPTQEVHIALVGKYVAVHDAYLSVHEALVHAGIANLAAVYVDYISSDELTAANAAERLGSYHGIILPGGFGHRGAEGMMAAANFARTKGIPCLMIGYGMQLGVVEAVRSLLSLPDANSTEVNRLANPAVVAIPRDRVDENDGRQNARMGGMDVVLTEGSRTAAIYGLTMVHERHGNRYEVDDALMRSLRRCTRSAWISSASARTEITRRYSRFRRIRSISAQFIIRSSFPAPTRRIRCSRRSLAQRRRIRHKEADIWPMRFSFPAKKNGSTADIRGCSAAILRALRAISPPATSYRCIPARANFWRRRFTIRRARFPCAS